MTIIPSGQEWPNAARVNISFPDPSEKPDGEVLTTESGAAVWAPNSGGGLPDPSGKPDGDVLTTASGAAVWAGGGGSQTLAEVLATGADMGGHTITDGSSSLKLGPSGIAKLETALDIAIHATVQDIAVTADAGNINVNTDPVTGGGIDIDAGTSLFLTGRGPGGVSITSQTGNVGVSSAKAVTIDSGFGTGDFSMYEDGSASFTLTPVPDDSLFAGTFGFWLDPTVGAAKIKFKAKDADGTVVTGEISLAP